MGDESSTIAKESDRSRRLHTSFLYRAAALHVTILYRMHPATARMALATASLIAALISLVAGVAGLPYKPILFLAPWPWWAAAFFIHWLGVTWRIIDRKTRVGAALVINSYGLFIWIVATIATALDTGGYAQGLAACVALCFISAWALYRTGRVEEPSSTP